MSPIPMRQSRRRLMLAARIPNSLLTLINKSHPLAWTKSLAGTDTEIEGCEASVGQIKEENPPSSPMKMWLGLEGSTARRGNFTLNNSISS